MTSPRPASIFRRRSYEPAAPGALGRPASPRYVCTQGAPRCEEGCQFVTTITATLEGAQHYIEETFPGRAVYVEDALTGETWSKLRDLPWMPGVHLEPPYDAQVDMVGCYAIAIRFKRRVLELRHSFGLLPTEARRLARTEGVPDVTV